jgi:cytochrome c oxidase subunit 2
MASKGRTVYERLGCNGCHLPEGGGRGPSLAGLLGRKVAMGSGETVLADEGYFRESVLNPRARLVAGYEAIMPTFQGQVSEEQLLQLLAYVKTQKSAERTATE